MSNFDPDLFKLVNQLTAEHEWEVTDFYGKPVGYRQQAGLLLKLREARSPSGGSESGRNSASAAHERSPMNFEASNLYAAIEKRVRSWAKAAEVQRHWATGSTPVDWTDLAALLRAWYQKTLSNARFEETAYVSTLLGWTRQIADMLLDPPERLTIRDDDNHLRPCPICGQSWAVRDIGGEEERIPALSYLIRNQDDQKVICQACETIWPDVESVRNLASTFANWTAA